jgi:hypothetical protein
MTSTSLSLAPELGLAGAETETYYDMTRRYCFTLDLQDDSQLIADARVTEMCE